MPGGAVSPRGDGPVVALVVSGAGGVEEVREKFVRPAVERGWTVPVTATPTGGHWLADQGETTPLEQLTGFPVRVEARPPGHTSPRPRADCVVVAPASANSVAKLALGIADNQALTLASEAIGSRATPVVVFPRINAAHARHPSWNGHIRALTSAGVHLIRGEDVWPLYEPRSAPAGRPLPWPHILNLVDNLLGDLADDPDSLYGTKW